MAVVISVQTATKIRNAPVKAQNRGIVYEAREWMLRIERECESSIRSIQSALSAIKKIAEPASQADSAKNSGGGLPRAVSESRF
jgi:hypothetical protein